MQMKDRTVLITGGGTGIGRALARQFAARGNQVTICGRRSDKLDEVVAAVPGVRSLRADVRELEGHAALLAEAAGDRGFVDVLVNNAASFHTILDFERDFTPGSVEQAFATNVVAPLGLIRRFADQLPAGRPGRIINIGSVAAWLSIDTQAVYVATKAALHSFSRSARDLLRPRGIVLHEVMTPGVETEMVADLEIDKMDPAVLAQLVLEHVERGTEEIRIGPDARFVYFGTRLFPDLMRRLVRARLTYRSARS